MIHDAATSHGYHWRIAKQFLAIYLIAAGLLIIKLPERQVGTIKTCIDQGARNN